MKIDLKKSAEDVGKEIVLKYMSVDVSIYHNNGICFTTSTEKMIVDSAYKCSIIAVELLLNVCPEGTFNNPNKKYMKLSEVKEYLTNKIK